MANKKKLPVLYLIIPCYNEEKALPLTYPLFVGKVEELIKAKTVSPDSRVLFINDGSADGTWDLIKELSLQNKLIEGICLSRNRGHQNALLAGLMEAKDRCDVTISLDCDGQNDINAVDEMMDRYKEGYEIVYGVRKQRDGDAVLKTIFSELYYRIMNLLGANIITNHADYRLVSSRVLNEFKDYQEVHIFLRGLFTLVGFKSTIVNYDQHPRAAGKTHYDLGRMLRLAVDGITSMSIVPIRMITIFGVILSLFNVVMLLVNLFSAGDSRTLHLMFYSICLLFGLLFIALGIVGEYVGKTYLEAKHRPRYIISERTYQE